MNEVALHNLLSLLPSHEYGTKKEDIFSGS